MDSREIVGAVLGEVRGQGFQVVNVDTIVHAEAPRIGPHREAIRSSLAGMLDLEEGSVGVKAKTAEGLGEIGRGEAIAAEVVVLLEDAR
jgi:2-C-methyl-D-erythritol 2,4-cyclodiphosphate synthase